MSAKVSVVYSAVNSFPAPVDSWAMRAPSSGSTTTDELMLGTIHDATVAANSTGTAENGWRLPSSNEATVQLQADWVAVGVALLDGVEVRVPVDVPLELAERLVEEVPVRVRLLLVVSDAVPDAESVAEPVMLAELEPVRLAEAVLVSVDVPVLDPLLVAVVVSVVLAELEPVRLAEAVLVTVDVSVLDSLLVAVAVRLLVDVLEAERVAVPDAVLVRLLVDVLKAERVAVPDTVVVGESEELGLPVSLLLGVPVSELLAVPVSLGEAVPVSLLLGLQVALELVVSLAEPEADGEEEPLLLDDGVLLVVGVALLVGELVRLGDFELVNDAVPVREDESEGVRVAADDRLAVAVAVPERVAVSVRVAVSLELLLAVLEAVTVELWVGAEDSLLVSELVRVPEPVAEIERVSLRDDVALRVLLRVGGTVAVPELDAPIVMVPELVGVSGGVSVEVGVVEEDAVALDEADDVPDELLEGDCEVEAVLVAVPVEEEELVSVAELLPVLVSLEDGDPVSEELAD